MSMRDRWTSNLHGGSPQGLPSSKWRVEKLSTRLFCSWTWRMCSWFNKTCSLQKHSNMVSTKAKKTGFNIPRATIKFHLPTWPEQQRAYMYSACRITLTSSKCKQSSETFVVASKHFQFSLFWNGKGREMLKKHSKFQRVGSCVRKPMFSSAVN